MSEIKSEIIKESQGRKLRNVLAPVRFLGKKFLGIKSEIYSEALITIEKADDIIRDSTFKQKVYLKDMKSMKKKLQGVRFAQAAAAFIREQELILQIINKIQSEFGKITGNSAITDINPYINKQIGLNQEYSSSQKTETKSDIDEEWDKDRPGYIDRILEYGIKPAIKRSPLSNEPYSVSESTRKQSNEFNGLVKEAILEGWYWRRTKSGKEYAKTFETVYESFKELFNKNVKLLEKLDELRSTGDPQGYFFTAKNPRDGFFAATNKVLKNEKFTSAWSTFNQLLVEQDKYEKDQQTNQVEDVKETIEQKLDQPVSTIKPEISLKDLEKKDNKKDSKKDFEIPDLDVKETNKQEPKQDTSYEDSVALLTNKNQPEISQPEVILEEPLVKTPEEYITEPLQEESKKTEEKKPDLLPEHISNIKLLPAHKSETADLIPDDIGNKKSAHNEFINQLVKISNCSPEIVACFMLNYANEIDELDNDYALKLTAIAEGVLNA